MSTEVRARLNGELEKEFNKFKGERRMTLSEATHSLISRGLSQEESAQLKAQIRALESLSVQNLMIVQRLLTAIDKDELLAAKNDAKKYLEKRG